MKVIYRGFDIEVYRGLCVGGWEQTFYSVFKQDTTWELTSGFSEFRNDIMEWIEDLKKLVDQYHENPEEFEDD